MQRSMASAGLIGLVFLFFALVSYLTGARLYFLFNLVLGVWRSCCGRPPAAKPLAP